MQIIPIIQIQNMTSEHLDKTITSYLHGETVFSPLFQKKKDILDTCRKCMLKNANLPGLNLETVRYIAKAKLEKDKHYNSKILSWRPILN